MSTRPMDDKLFEALLRQAVIDDYKDEIAALPSNTALKETLSFSAPFELRMKKLFSKEKRRVLLLTIAKYAKRVAIVILVVISLFFCMFFFNPKIRAAVQRIVVQWNSQFSSFSTPERGSDAPRVEAKNWVITQLPAGYTEKTVRKLGIITKTVFSNEQGDEIRFSYSSLEATGKLSVDNENTLIERGVIHGHDAYFFKAITEGFSNGVYWITDAYRFRIFSEKLSLKEIIKMAESVCELKE